MKVDIDIGPLFHLEKNDNKHFFPKFYLGLGFEVIISVAFTDAEKSAFDVLFFLCLWIDIMTLKKTMKGIMLYGFVSYKGHY